MNINTHSSYCVYITMDILRNVFRTRTLFLNQNLHRIKVTIWIEKCWIQEAAENNPQNIKMYK